VEAFFLIKTVTRDNRAILRLTSEDPKCLSLITPLITNGTFDVIVSKYPGQNVAYDLIEPEQSRIGNVAIKLQYLKP
jgi:hypothetical protein